MAVKRGVQNRAQGRALSRSRAGAPVHGARHERSRSPELSFQSTS